MKRLGVLGGGQLGRMMAQAASRLGVPVCVFTPEADSPALQVAPHGVIADYTDTTALKVFAEQVDAVTLEFENIPVAAVEALSQWVPVRPGATVLATAQNRLREKGTLSQAGFPVTPFAPVLSVADLPNTVQRVGFPAVLKTSDSGYDGKGQCRVQTLSEADAAFRALGEVPCVLEGWVSLAREVSVIVARTAWQLVDYGVIENVHRNHILHTSVAPGSATSLQAVQIARDIAVHLQLEGVLCVEFFEDVAGQLMVNEMAPRPHNSGHLTIEGCVTSQFEQQVRAALNWPLGPTEFLAPHAAMVNLLGDLWGCGEPDWPGLLAAFPTIKLHLYGKPEARPGRKMGHLTAVGPAALETVQAAFQWLADRTP
jgi:5-(carboxyamino)imidazole ribonucleotide synthase